MRENYLDFVRIKCFRDVLIKLRMGVLPLNANRFRYAHENASKILCSFCETEIEDEATGHVAVCDYMLQRGSSLSLSLSEATENTRSLLCVFTDNKYMG